MSSMGGKKILLCFPSLLVKQYSYRLLIFMLSHGFAGHTQWYGENRRACRALEEQIAVTLGV